MFRPLSDTAEAKPNRLRTAVKITVLLFLGWFAITLLPTQTRSPLSASPALAGQSQRPEKATPPWPIANSDFAPDPAIHFGRLSNGFRYVLMRNQRPENRVSVHLVIQAGSLNESETQEGVAHFLEHMQFNGSTHFPPGELVRYFQSIGMQFGNDANAHTGFNETVYDLILPTGEEEDLKSGLLVMSDYAMGALLLEEEVRRERGVILAEMRSRDSAAFRTYKSTLNFELPEFLVSKRLPIGQEKVIENADRPLLKDFYDGWYRPDAMVLVMVGDFSVSLAERLIVERFEDFKARAPVPRKPPMGMIDHKGLDVFYYYEPDLGGTTVSIETVRFQDQPVDSLTLRRRELASQMADRMVQYRLDARLKTPDAPFTSASIGSGVYLNSIRYAEITADSSNGNWSQTLTFLEQTLRQARLYGFTETELARAKKEIQKLLDNGAREAPTRNSTTLARSIIQDLLENRVIQSPDQEKFTMTPLVNAITLEEVDLAFVDDWPNDHRLVLVTGNADLNQHAEKPAASVIRDTYLAAASTTLHRPEAGSIIAFPYLPGPQGTGSIRSREVLEDLGITRIGFSNNVWLNLKKTPYKTNEVLANLAFGYGRSTEPNDLPGLALLAEATVDESGLGAMDTDELERALAGKSTAVDFSITDTHFIFFARSVSGEMELLFQLLEAHVKDPGFRDDAFQLARERLHQEYQSLNRSIDGMMKIEGQRILAGGDSRFGMPSFEKIQSIRLEDVRNWLLPPLTSAPLELSIVGDFDENEIIELAGRYMGTLPQRNDQANPPGRADRVSLPTGTVKRIGVDTQISKALVVAAWQTEDFWNISRTRRLSVLADVFSERLRERIREKLGVSYAPYAFNQSSRAYPGYGVLQAYVTVAPDQTDSVLKEVRSIARDLASTGVTADELTRAIDPILTSIREYRQTNGYWLNSVMSGSQRAPQQLDWARSFIDDYGAVSREDLAALAATYLTDERAAAIIIAQTPRPKG